MNARDKYVYALWNAKHLVQEIGFFSLFQTKGLLNFNARDKEQISKKSPTMLKIDIVCFTGEEAKNSTETMRS